MRELSLHILDLAQNSITAGARNLRIEVIANTDLDLLTISMSDDGKGMPCELLERVKDPFTTTRRTRRVGLGIPMLYQAAKATGGNLAIESREGNGTSLTAVFHLSHIDRAPYGDIAATLISIVAVNPDLELVYTQRVDKKEFVLDTREVKSRIGGVPINEHPVLHWLSDYVKEGTSGPMQIS